MSQEIWNQRNSRQTIEVISGGFWRLDPMFGNQIRVRGVEIELLWIPRAFFGAVGLSMADNFEVRVAIFINVV